MQVKFRQINLNNSRINNNNPYYNHRNLNKQDKVKLDRCNLYLIKIESSSKKNLYLSILRNRMNDIDWKK